MTDYTKMTASEMLQDVGDDAQKWAAAFCQTAEKLGHHGIDEGWMIGWFANAIELSTAVRAARTPAPEGEVVGTAGVMPGTSGFTTAVFRASAVPVGTPLYASPVVPVGVSREAQRPLAEAIYRQVEPLLAECSEPNPEDYIDAVFAALRFTDTGRE